MLFVKKFGGTSVGTTERIQAVAERVEKTVRKGHACAVVVSAMGHTTDELVRLAEALSSQPSRREMDALLATGEQVTTALLAMALHERGIVAESFTGWQAGIKTEATHGAARIEAIETEALRALLDRGGVPVIAGFQGIAGMAITTLGRGGSDTTAVAVAAALSADYCEIYTDVTGVYTADPRRVRSARKLSHLLYDEMLELANLGSQVLHPRAVETAKRHGIKLVVRSSFDEAEGTVVGDMSMEGARVVTGVACEKEVARIALVGMPKSGKQLADVFGALANEHVNVDVIVQSIVRQGEVDVSFTVAESELTHALAICSSLATKTRHQSIVQERGLSKISIVGAGMISNPGVAAQMFEALERAGVDVLMVSTSEIKVSCVIAQDYLDAAVRAVHDSFHLGEGDAHGYS
ncbi:aspartate kinase [Ferroacidibacillus organovorans]|uniref:aspartate kinase n=1 Tax=Ferroacidibacillus organovorans TaxID=1765683 RepID=UPI0007A88222|nr:aspartate kinase [Ferroacidibacillus organovorans]KYP79222.1 aspartate kinase [Ferroacidibacillus organovorans]